MSLWSNWIFWVLKPVSTMLAKTPSGTISLWLNKTSLPLPYKSLAFLHYPENKLYIQFHARNLHFDIWCHAFSCFLWFALCHSNNIRVTNIRSLFPAQANTTECYYCFLNRRTSGIEQPLLTAAEGWSLGFTLSRCRKEMGLPLQKPRFQTQQWHWLSAQQTVKNWINTKASKLCHMLLGTK